MISILKALRLFVAPLLCTAGLCIGIAHADGPSEILITTGPYGGIYYPLGNSICRLFNRDIAPDAAFCDARDSKGSVENIAALRAGKVQFAIVQSDIVVQAEQGIGAFAGEPAYAGLRVVLLGHGEPFTLMTRPGSGINGIEDLPGHRVSVGRIGTGQLATVETLFADLGWTRADFAGLPEMTREDQVVALCDGRVDAIAMLIGHPNGYVQKAIETCDARLVPIQGPQIDRVVAQHIEFNPAAIPGGIYANHRDPTTSFGVVAVLVTDARVPDDVVTGIVSAAYRNVDVLKRLHAAFAGFTPQNMVPRESWAELDPAAKAYFVEHGLLANP
jgi:TRAP transporter TAXI family solute receptor